LTAVAGSLLASDLIHKRGCEEEALLLYGFSRNFLNFQSKSFKMLVFRRACCRALLNLASPGLWVAV